MSKQRKVEPKRVAPSTSLPVAKIAPMPIRTDEEVEDEMFEQELAGQHASFVAGTPFVKTPDGT